MMKNKLNFLLSILLVLTLLAACGKNDGSAVSRKESTQAKQMLQGVWIDAETEEVSFRAEGDTIYYPDRTSMPAYFKIVDDSLVLGSQSYAIIKQTEHLFWFQNQAGDVVKLTKSEGTQASQTFEKEQKQSVIISNQLVKSDSIVMYEGERYHLYIDINPTKYKVVKTNYNDDGVGVENVYYDNIIHISVFRGVQKLFSSNLRKQDYAKQVPQEFLQQAILANMQYESIDAQGFHFNATLCIPDGASCYMVSTDFTLKGQMTMKLLEY